MGEFENLHQILLSLYEEMMPLCSDMAGVAKGLAGLGALFYVAMRVWQSLARAEAIDVYPLLRPFAIGLCILFFPTVVLGTMNSVLGLVVEGTHSMLEEQTFDMNRYREQKDRLEYEAMMRNPETAYLASDEELDRLSKIFDKRDVQVNEGYLNNLRLRFPNEPSRHKLLDMIGDLALIGQRIRGRIVAYKPGHAANTEFAKMIRKEIKRGGTRPMFRIDPAAKPLYDINQIKRLLPHRPPFLLVDKVMHLDSEHVVGFKNVTMNEPFFVGHFPDEPVMPGVLIVEAMAQCSGILVLGDVPDPENYSTYFMKIDGVKFKRKIIPGDTLQFELHLTEPIRRGVCVMDAKAFVGDTLACEATLMAQVAKTKK